MKKQKAIEALTRECKRCQYSWVLRKAEEPLRCPKCYSPYWNRERKVIPKE